MTLTGHIIVMTRGDDETLKVVATDRGFLEGEKIEFTVRKEPSCPALIYKKVVAFDDDDAAIIEIAHADTAELEPGRYVYDVQLTFADGQIQTVVKPNDFIITEEVTYHA